jgi:hypothetical protein
MKPIPLGSFVPPVTGTNGRPGAVASNLYDVSGNFRDRTGSFKRRRTGDERDLDDRFDITRNYPPLCHPPKPNFDVDSIQALMVDASSKAEAIKARNDDPTSTRLRKTSPFSISRSLLCLPPLWRKPLCLSPTAPPPSWNHQSVEAPLLPPNPFVGKKN